MMVGVDVASKFDWTIVKAVAYECGRPKDIQVYMWLDEKKTRVLMSEKGLSVSVLAEKVGIHIDTLYKYLRGDRRPYRHIESIAHVLDTELNNLLRGEVDSDSCEVDLTDSSTICERPTRNKVPTDQRRRDLLDVHVSLFKLPTTGKELFGREKELQMLDEAWADAHTNILSLVAWGGVGKTALVNYWLNQMEHDNWRGAERIFGWSFYSQGTREDRQASGDEFLAYALKWFGDPDPKEGSPWNKGLRLADLIRQQRTLLILDGLEPLQYPPGSMEGRLKDQGLQALLKELVRSNPGLCIITTREKVKDIDHAEGSSLKRIFLENLSLKAGAELLKSLGVKGTDKELGEAVEGFGGHALALNLLGSFLATVHEGNIRKWFLIPQLATDQEYGGHARRVMESYETWLMGTLELDILYLMGLFDRPAPGGAINVLRENPAIEGLTDRLQGLSETNWQYAVKHLRDLRLLGQRDENDPEKLDCHPLVREHFGEKLKKNNPQGWREAHDRLYEYYKGIPEKLYGKFLPDTLEEMEPLLCAVSHGCQAGRHQETLDDVYWKRIKRGIEAYSVKKLGAFGADLAAMSNLFSRPWTEPAASLNDRGKAAALNWAGFTLGALGRPAEAIEPMKLALQLAIEQEAWRGAATNASNLSELYLAFGKIEKARDYARKGVQLGEKSLNWYLQIMMLTSLADIMHLVGEFSESGRLYYTAEQILREREPQFLYLYSIAGVRFCDLLLSQGQYRQVQERASHTLEWDSEKNWLLDMALDKLSLGRAYLIQASLDESGDFTKAADFLNQAVDGLREAGAQEFIVRGLLARAELYRYQRSWEKEWTDLEEAKEIAERGQMNLYMADYHLEAARLCLAEGKKAEAREHRKEAAKRVKDMGYHRRDPEVLLIQAELELAEGNKKQAKETLKTAERRINEMGCHRWDKEVKRLKGLIDRRRHSTY